MKYQYQLIVVCLSDPGALMNEFRSKFYQHGWRICTIYPNFMPNQQAIAVPGQPPPIGLFCWLELAVDETREQVNGKPVVGDTVATTFRQRPAEIPKVITE